MSEGRSLTGLPSDVVEELREIAFRVTQGLIPFRALKNVLTNSEWEQIQDELQEYFPSTESLTAGQKPKPLPHEYAIRTLVRLRNISQARAVIDLAWANELLSGASYQRLLQKIGEEQQPAPPCPPPPSAGPTPVPPVSVEPLAQPKPPRLPEWNGQLCELRLDGDLIKRVRGRSVASNVVRVLDAFQEDGWPRHIDDPLPGRANFKRLHDTISSLNEGLRGIRFRADGSGEGIRWDPAPTP